VKPEASSFHNRISAREWAEMQQRIIDNTASTINRTPPESAASSSWGTDMVWVEKARYNRAKKTAEIRKTEEYSKISAKLFSSLPTACPDSVANSWISLAQATDSAILYLQTDIGFGTAFLISPDGYALTCNHVISGANKIEARFRMPSRAGGSDSWHNCKVINTKVDLDIALIKLDGENFPYLSLAPEGRVIQKGEDFILSGYPLGKRTAKDLTTFHGYVASTEKQTDDNGFARYNINCEAKSGNSGAPIIALADGRVIGILLGSIPERTSEILTEEINYMRPVQYFWEEFVN
jgi:S1-C subfamily serine protease